MAKDLTLGYDVVAHFSQNVVERVFQSYYLSGFFPSRVTAPIPGTGESAEVFFGLPRLRLVSAPGIDNAVRLSFGYLIRLTNYDGEEAGEASMTVAAQPVTIDGRFTIRVDLDIGPDEVDTSQGGSLGFERILRSLVVGSLIGPGRSVVLAPPAMPSSDRLTFRSYPGPGGGGFVAVFVEADAQPQSPPPAPPPPAPPAMPSLLSASQDLAVALPLETVEGILAGGLAAAGLGELPATMDFDGTERTVEAIAFRLTDHHLVVTGRIDGVEFTAKALLYGTGGGHAVLIQSLDVDLPWYLDVVDTITGGVITRAITEAFPALLGTIGGGAAGGIGLFATELPVVDTVIELRDVGYAAISRLGMVVPVEVTPKPSAVPIQTPTYVKGNRKTKEFHRSGCPYGDKLKGYERFVRESAAIRAGYNGCFTCAHEFSHPLGNLIFGFRSSGNQPNSLLTLQVSIEGRLVAPIVVDGVLVTNPPFSRSVKLTGKVDPDGGWQRTLYDSTALLIPARWRLRASVAGWTGELTGLIKPTARNFGTTNMITFTVGRPTGNIGYGTMPPYP